MLTSKVNVPVLGYKCNERVREIDSISGELRVPVQKLSSTPVVVIMHSNAGIIGVGEYYAKALNTAGIATLEIDSFTPEVFVMAMIKVRRCFAIGYKTPGVRWCFSEKTVDLILARLE